VHQRKHISNDQLTICFAKSRRKKNSDSKSSSNKSNPKRSSDDIAGQKPSVFSNSVPSDASSPPTVFKSQLPKDFKPRGITMQKKMTKQGYIKPDYSQATSLPEIVAQRMVKRSIWLFGVPLFTGIFGFVAFYVLSTQYEVTFLPSLVGTSTLGIFSLSLVGLTYGIMSASWDPEIEGSFLGFSEFRKNFVRAVEGVGRQKLQESAAEKDEL